MDLKVLAERINAEYSEENNNIILTVDPSKLNVGDMENIALTPGFKGATFKDIKVLLYFTTS